MTRLMHANQRMPIGPHGEIHEWRRACDGEPVCLPVAVSVLMQGNPALPGSDHGEIHEWSPICDNSPVCLPTLGWDEAVKASLRYTLNSPKKSPRERVLGSYDTTLNSLDQSTRAQVLDEARKLITGDRAVQYGPPTANFENTAAILNALGFGVGDRPIRSEDVGVMMMALKLARLAGDGMKRDTLVDLAGYAACTWECHEDSDAE